MNYSIESIIDRIPFFTDYSSVEKIKKGYSPDRKYIVKKGLTNYLLRISDIKYFEERKKEFHLLQELEAKNIQSQRPFLFGKFINDNICFMVIEYIEGTPAIDAFKKCSNSIQHQIGIAAGKELYKIHQIKPQSRFSKWDDRQRKKYKYYLREYQKGNFSLNQDSKIINYIDANIKLITDRPNALLHDDFHLEHIILSNCKYNGIIDFNGYDFGDPFHDFYNLSLFSRRISVPFSIGQIKGYFLREPSEYFWSLFSLYAAMNIFSTIVWTVKNDPDSFDDALERIDLILEDHDYFNSIKPRWYNSNL
ncbi:Predicted kinase, aminoglycoside phosphotransferase (APT) family [Oceanobacillus limi]|uniref:Predicted kinase, aminoglycoside phosphotransferase (APT) family n=1 Tax=Oceanobacillus limi TaxID=930131 RepID=A0A1I0HES7_9BACI|nr:aminoglycoside phosphotransferase family protein [Oceanobacillus limi]SET82422.1 Predicted kinase, aminoglycoside phosphotransferase (APT) family [Oceanobacillus limi]